MSIDIGTIIAKGLRYGIGEVYKTEQRKAQEAKALAWMIFDSEGRRDDWPMSHKSKLNEVDENLREEYRRTFGLFDGDGLNEIIKRFKAYLGGKPIDSTIKKPYGLGPVFIALHWKEWKENGRSIQ